MVACGAVFCASAGNFRPTCSSASRSFQRSSLYRRKICARCSVWPRGAAPCRVQPSSTVEPWVRRRNVEREPAMMVADARKAPSCIWPSLCWATSWPCMSPPPTLRPGRGRADGQGHPGGNRDQSVEVVFVDQGYTGDRPAKATQEHGIELDDIFWLGAALSSVSEGLSGCYTSAAWQRCN
jgi:hypothetical protein